MNFFRARSVPDRNFWNVREDDQIAPEIIRRAPMLEGIENNAAYRLIVWRQRRNPWWKSASVQSTALSVPLTLLTPRLTPLFEFTWLLCLFSMFITMGCVIGFILDYPWSGILSVLRRRTYEFFDVPKQYVGNLLDAGTASRDIALGIWGSACPTERKSRLAPAVLIALATVSSLLILFPGLPLLFAGLLRFSIWAAAFKFVIARYEPAWSLYVRIHDSMRWRGSEPWITITILPLFAVTALHAWVFYWTPMFCYFEWGLWVLSGTLGGILAGANAKRKAGPNFERLVRQVDSMFHEMVQARDPDPTWKA